MIISSTKEDLVNALNIVEKALPTKAVIPILSGIMIDARNNTIHLKATDTSIGIDTELKGNVIAEGAVVLNGRLFFEVARSLPKDQVILEVDEHYEASIKCGSSEISIKGMPANDFPPLPYVSDGVELNITSGTFRDMIRQTVFSVAVDESKGILMGELLKFDGNQLTLVAIDGYRISIRYEQLADGPNQAVEAVIPGRSLTELMRILPASDEILNMRIDDKHAMFSINGIIVITQLLDGRFMNYEDIINSEASEAKTIVRVNTNDLLSSIDRAMLVAKEGNISFIRLNISKDGMIITSNADIGKAHEEVPIDLEGSSVEIAFNGKYLSDPLKIIDDQQLMMRFNTDISPCIIEPVNGNKFLYLILPVRMTP